MRVRLVLCFVAMGLAQMVPMGSANAQSTDSVRVTVVDPSGLPVSGAKVENGEVEPSAKCVTDNTGGCSIGTRGEPKIQVIANGFAPEWAKTVPGVAEVKVTLHIRESYGVSVNATATTASTQAETRTGEQIDRLPVWLRKMENIQPLFPGAIAPPTDSTLGVGLSAAGSRNEAMNSLLDGMPNRAERRGGMAINPPLESVSEFRLLTSGYSAEYGHTTGPQAVLTTRTGTERLHGDFYNYARDRLGGMMGGPIRRGKAYFFGSYERASTNFDSPLTLTVPKPEQMTVGANELSRALIPLMPVSATGVKHSEGEHSLESVGLLRVDWILDSQTRLMARLARQSGWQILQPDAYWLSPAYWPPVDDSANSAVVGIQHDRPSTSFTLRASYLDNIGDTMSGCHASSRFAVHFSGSSATRGCPMIVVRGYDTIGDAASLYTYRSRTGEVSGIVGANFDPDSVRFGANVTTLRYSAGNPSFENGVLTFSGVYSGSGLGDFLLGQPATATRSFGNSANAGELKETDFGGFVQYSLRLGEPILLEAGLRVDYFPSLVQNSRGLTSFWPSTGKVMNSANASLLSSPGMVAEPRLGFSVRLFGNSTVLRGGAGQYSGNDILSAVLGQLTSAPQRYQISFTPATYLPFSPQSPVWTPIDISTTRGINPANNLSRVYQYSLTIERSLKKGMEVEASYVGSRGLHLGRLANINAALPTGAWAASGKPVMARRYPAFGDILYDDQGASSRYDSGVLKVRHRGGALDMSLAYTFSKSIDDASSTGSMSFAQMPWAQDARDLRAERAVSDFNRKHQFSGYATVLLDRVSKKAALRRSELSVMFNLGSGIPFTPLTDFSGQYRPDRVSDPYKNVPAGHLFNPAAFVAHVPDAANPTYFGNAGRNCLTTPAFRTIDIAFNKGFRVRQKVTIDVRAEAFNILNYRVFLPDNLVSEPWRFGLPRNNLNEERHIVAGARVSF